MRDLYLKTVNKRNESCVMIVFTRLRATAETCEFHNQKKLEISSLLRVIPSH